MKDKGEMLKNKEGRDLALCRSPSHFVLGQINPFDYY
jgi:hypothetical protein